MPRERGWRAAVLVMRAGIQADVLRCSLTNSSARLYCNTRCILMILRLHKSIHTYIVVETTEDGQEFSLVLPFAAWLHPLSGLCIRPPNSSRGILGTERGGETGRAAGLVQGRAEFHGIQNCWLVRRLPEPYPYNSRAVSCGDTSVDAHGIQDASQGFGCVGSRIPAQESGGHGGAVLLYLLSPSVIKATRTPECSCNPVALSITVESSLTLR